MLQWQLMIIFIIGSVIGLLFILAKILSALFSVFDWVAPPRQTGWSKRRGPEKQARVLNLLDVLHAFVLGELDSTFSPWIFMLRTLLIGGPEGIPPLWILIALYISSAVSSSGTSHTASPTPIQIALPRITQQQAHLALVAATTIVALLLAWILIRLLLAVLGKIKITRAGVLWLIGELTAIAGIIIGHYWK